MALLRKRQLAFDSPENQQLVRKGARGADLSKGKVPVDQEERPPDQLALPAACQPIRRTITALETNIRANHSMCWNASAKPGPKRD